MRNEQVYQLADSAVIEPLVNHWSAWAHLISPAPASLHLLNYQVKTLLSYLENPEYHFNASHDPNLIGGRFIDVDPSRAPEVEELLKQTLRKQKRNLEFATALLEFSNLLINDAKGQSLESYYQKLPPELRGYVELVYDYYDRPALRFMEGLLYESKYYNQGLQSLRISRLEKDNARRFFMSTPRLMEPGQIDWVIPFEDASVDDFFQLDVEAQPLDRILETLGLSRKNEKDVLPFLAAGSRSLPESWKQDEIRIKYFGHACVLIEWNGVAILTDPYIGVIPQGGGDARLSYHDLPEKIDYALITHNHQDHFALETLLRLRRRIGALVVPRSHGILLGDISLKVMARKLGFNNVIEMETFDAIGLPDGEIVAVPFLGEHGDLAHGKSAYVVRAGGEQMLFAADSDCLDKNIYENIRKHLGPVETVFLGMECVGAPLSWSCGPLFPRKPQHNYDQTRRYHGCNSSAALDLLETVGAKRMYNYAMGEEPWIEFLLGLGLSPDSTQIHESNKLLARTRELGFIASERLSGKKEFILPRASRNSRRNLARRLGERQFGKELRAISSRSKDVRRYPLSLAQEKLWLAGHATSPEREIENHVIILRLCGALNKTALDRSLSEVIRRHKVLSVQFTVVEGEVHQIPILDPKIVVETIDLTQSTEDRQEIEIQLAAGREALSSFDDAGSGLLRARLFKLRENEHALLLTLGYMSSDHRSLEILYREVIDHYEMYSTTNDVAPSVLNVQYLDYALWEREQLTGEEPAGRRNGQEQNLSGPMDAQTRVADPRPPNPLDARRHETQSFGLSRSLIESLSELAERQGANLYTVLLASFKALLLRLMDKDDVEVRAIVDNRRIPETGSMIGPLSNVLTLRNDQNGDPSFLRLLRQVHERVFSLKEIQDPSFDAGGANGTQTACKSRCQAFFHYGNESLAAATLRNLQISPQIIPSQNRDCDIAVYLSECRSEVTGLLKYSLGESGHQSASSISAQYQRLLELIAARPEWLISDIPLHAEEALHYGDEQFAF